MAKKKKSDKRRKRASSAQPVCVLKVALAGHRRVWRRIAIRANQTLDDVHATIFDAFDR